MIFDDSLLPCGPALPPLASMKFKTNAFGWIHINIQNENFSHAVVSINDQTYFVPAAGEKSKGHLKFKRWGLGKSYVLKNQSEWVLAVEN